MKSQFTFKIPDSGFFTFEALALDEALMHLCHVLIQDAADFLGGILDARIQETVAEEIEQTSILQFNPISGAPEYLRVCDGLAADDSTIQNQYHLIRHI